MKHIQNYTTIYSPDELQLAHEMASRLDDSAAMGQWLKYTRTVPHDFLRAQMDKVCSLEAHRVRTTRVRLFVSIIENYLRYPNGYSGN